MKPLLWIVAVIVIIGAGAYFALSHIPISMISSRIGSMASSTCQMSGSTATSSTSTCLYGGQIGQQGGQGSVGGGGSLSSMTGSNSSNASGSGQSSAKTACDYLTTTEIQSALGVSVSSGSPEQLSSRPPETSCAYTVQQDGAADGNSAVSLEAVTGLTSEALSAYYNLVVSEGYKTIQGIGDSALELVQDKDGIGTDVNGNITVVVFGNGSVVSVTTYTDNFANIPIVITYDTAKAAAESLAKIAANEM